MTPVSEKEGETIILHTGLILHINDQIKWMFNGQLIPEINEGTNGRLYLDRPSGSLIITKSKITDSGVYHLNMISSSYTVQRNISVTVTVLDKKTPDPGVFGVDVTVMKGDSVTLKHQAEIKKNDSANWKFNDIIIAQKRTAGNFYKSEGDDGRFKNCLNLEQQTGYLTITNITSDHAGPYTLNIKKSTNETSKIFSVTVTDNVTSLSVLKGDTVTLHTGVTGELILWKFGDQELTC
ncbi:uncharacterized protein LOC120475687 [Pimephales promelas]|uniref:uncharacterized protein LOC120475687 n=1 Tax=Pimephales promelas TaxID=90988 RepID=UPI001955F3C4|nr:uncharacterized protein LOC120475687 [Pimephales promelas]